LTVLFATAEYETVVKVGGLGEASRGLTRSLGDHGIDVEVVLPDYGGLPVEELTAEVVLDTPEWVGPATTRRVRTALGEELTLVRLASMERPHPYNEPASGFAWHDNDHRFFAFSAAVAALAEQRQPDVVHVNDWHTATVPAFADSTRPTVLTVHNAAYQGTADPGWTSVLRNHHAAYQTDWRINPLAGGISTCDRVVAVSQGYANDLRAGTVANLTSRCRERGPAFVGIRNGIDTGYWDPVSNPHVPAPFDHRDLSGKEVCRKELLRRTTLDDDDQPIIAVIGRLVEQKGVDLVLNLTPFLESIGAKLVVIGDGEADRVAHAARTAGAQPERVHFFGQYSDETAALMLAGADLLLAPSRFEPCGLTQMQAMRFGTVPVVTAVGGLGETVIDSDAWPRCGNGFVAALPDPVHLLDALHRSVRGLSERRRHRSIQQRGMRADWSWRPQAKQYIAVYDQATAEAH
jgi:starch synthase